MLPTKPAADDIPPELFSVLGKLQEAHGLGLAFMLDWNREPGISDLTVFRPGTEKALCVRGIPHAQMAFVIDEIIKAKTA